MLDIEKTTLESPKWPLGWSRKVLFWREGRETLINNEGELDESIM